MEVVIKRNGVYNDVQFRDRDTIIDLGLHSDGESRELAGRLLEAVTRLVPNPFSSPSYGWIAVALVQVGYDPAILARYLAELAEAKGEERQ